MNAREIAENNMIFKCVVGSRAYGTHTSSSDTDIAGVFIAPAECILGLSKRIEQVQYKEGTTETTLYELRKFIELCLQNNPNIFDSLFAPDDCVLLSTEFFGHILSARHLFLSKKIKYTYTGYMHSQLQRITRHHKWIEDPQSIEQPAVLNFCKIVTSNGQVISNRIAIDEFLQSFSNGCFCAKTAHNLYRIFSSDVFKKNIISDDGVNITHIDVSDDILFARNVLFRGMLLFNEQGYSEAYRKWNHYWQWKANRNPERAAKEEEFGIDVKHAAHAVRLLEMCEEILSTGQVNVRRQNIGLLRNILDGMLTYDQILQLVAEHEKNLDVLYEQSTLPHSPDHGAIDTLYQDIVREYWSIKNPDEWPRYRKK